jgi:predicted alpha/beta hydrolase
MKPLFFGDAKRQLFGVFQPAEDDAPQRDVAVVLSYPGMPEYNMSHWSFRRLAGLLSRQGFPSFRFDYYGTGDSSGCAEAGDLTQWVEDIGTAAVEARDLSGAREISLVGMRLGAALAATAVAQGLVARDLVLWDPVVCGASYLHELERLDAYHRLMRLYPKARPCQELLGFTLPNHVRRQLEELDLARYQLTSCERLVIVASEDREEDRRLASVHSARVVVAADDESNRSHVAEGMTAQLTTKPLIAIVEALANGGAD